jgi:hypothetical protein
VSPQMAYRHYFGAKPAARSAPARKPG